MKVFINPGHDVALDSGAVNPVYGTRECDVARDAGKMLARYLETAGCEVRTLQNDDLGLVCAESNAWGADIFVSLHCNAFNTQARGTETLYKTFNNGQQLANDIQSQIIRSINTVDRGVKERQDLWVLNGTDATAVLVEMAFIDNDEDLALLNNDLDSIVRAIARGITDFIGGE
ncbi:N-acetylmuramoyl-L-alanine amidase family protein [Veillonella parvula]|uniref:N-acetylmuramoyl-L-alanine amidase family protein n=1 Tax=Veillonella parvula TaxID=29466 RepID=UPI00265CA105|nr:N-acetylmuramoyl-L-alanine amidase [Veillonella parvula]